MTPKAAVHGARRHAILGAVQNTTQSVVQNVAWNVAWNVALNVVQNAVRAAGWNAMQGDVGVDVKSAIQEDLP